MAVPSPPRKNEDGFSASLADFIRFFVTRLEPLQVERVADVETAVEHWVDVDRYMVRARVSFVREALEELVLQVLRGMGLSPEFQLRISTTEWVRIEEEFTEWQRTKFGKQFTRDEAYRQQVQEMLRRHSSSWANAFVASGRTYGASENLDPYPSSISYPLSKTWGL